MNLELADGRSVKLNGKHARKEFINNVKQAFNDHKEELKRNGINNYKGLLSGEFMDAIHGNKFNEVNGRNQIKNNQSIKDKIDDYVSNLNEANIRGTEVNTNIPSTETTPAAPKKSFFEKVGDFAKQTRNKAGEYADKAKNLADDVSVHVAKSAGKAARAIDNYIHKFQ